MALLRSRSFLGSEHPVLFPISLRYEFSQHPHVLGRILGETVSNGDFGSMLDHARLVTVANHAAGCAGRGLPLSNFAARILHVHDEPGMRIRQSDLINYSLQGRGLASVSYTHL